MDNTAQQPSTNSQSAPPPITSKKSPTLLLIISLAMLGIGLGGGYFLANNLNAPAKTPSKTETIPTPTPTVIPTIPATANQKVTPPTELKNEVTTPQLKSIPIISTNGWKPITFKGITFKIPSDLTFKDLQDTSNHGIIYREGEAGGPRAVIGVQDYKGGSRRQEFFGNNYYDCHYIYEDAMFGKVKALQIAADTNWCYGAGAIVTVVGNKLVYIPNLGYNENKIITRYDLVDAIVSTISSQ